ncbi:hypothetical protein GCM10011583_34210 [Streptomyces camponoticapitis]|uniref:Lipoprotein n=1 Tax=Streptomyces camponoticapitis TaxID=1616125 RepID=A0ABQ2E7Z3_9ACTN|nr:hypothetical protein GCM10011583_34210 [Streptomyces camponoticapitis]
MISVRWDRRIVLSGLSLLLLSVSGCVGVKDDNGSQKLDQEAVVGTWQGVGGGLASFSRDGTVELSGVTCQQVFTEGDGGARLAGTWSVQAPRSGGSPWVSLKFPPGSCGAEGVTESGFYAYKGSGDLVIHLGDPDLIDKNVDFHKE